MQEQKIWVRHSTSDTAYVADEFHVYDDALAVKKIATSDISQVIPRRNWTTGTVYDYYRHDYGNRVTGTTNTQSADSSATNLFDATFYVMSSAFNVYKCLDNNSGATSTVEATGTSTSILTTADGYGEIYVHFINVTTSKLFINRFYGSCN